MAYIQATNLIVRLREVLEDSDGSLRTVPTGRYEGDFPQGLSDETQARRTMEKPRVRVNVNVIGRSQYSPPINSNLIIYDVQVAVTVARLLDREKQISPNDYDDVQAAAAEDADVVRQALEWPGNLTQTQGGQATDLVSGMLEHFNSTYNVVGLVDQGAQRIEGTHTFNGFLLSRPAT